MWLATLLPRERNISTVPAIDCTCPLFVSGLDPGPQRLMLSLSKSVSAPATSMSDVNQQDRALINLGQALRERGYHFTTITPASHRRVVSRPLRLNATLEDVFGWSRPFGERDIPGDLLTMLRGSGLLRNSKGRLSSCVRFSTLGGQLFAHSAFPTEHGDAVFFGPDTYRFARAITQSIAAFAHRPDLRVLDIGAGSGAGGLHAAALLRDASPQLTLTDINHGALRFSRINAILNGATAEIIESDLYAVVEGDFDLIVSNPPYLVDPMARLYRHGGGKLGSALSIRIVEEGIAKLAPGGRLLLYTGSAIVDGIDVLHETLREALTGRRVRFAYEEIDPDVFGEELESRPYDRADRIAVVAAIIDRREEIP